jgi:hypothetical protein
LRHISEEIFGLLGMLLGLVVMPINDDVDACLDRGLHHDFNLIPLRLFVSQIATMFRTDTHRSSHH